MDKKEATSDELWLQVALVSVVVTLIVTIRVVRFTQVYLLHGEWNQKVDKETFNYAKETMESTMAVWHHQSG